MYSLESIQLSPLLLKLDGIKCLLRIFIPIITVRTTLGVFVTRRISRILGSDFRLRSSDRPVNLPYRDIWQSAARIGDTQRADVTIPGQRSPRSGVDSVTTVGSRLSNHSHYRSTHHKDSDLEESPLVFP